MDKYNKYIMDINRDPVIVTKPKENAINTDIYRYKFSEELKMVLYGFAKLHEFTDRKIYKEKWEEFLKINNAVILKEVRDLHNKGYNGDIMDKMYKSARYYYRKKKTTKVDPKKRRPYISLSRNYLDVVDEHITNNNCKPSDGYINFCTNNKDIIMKEILLLKDQHLTDVEILDKLKKTYKNRHFQLNKIL